VRFTLPTNLTTESDVEQKLIYPLLISEPPYGLGLQEPTILTKVNIRRFPIGKGNDRKIYFPDYMVVIGGFPLAAVEAKAPGEDVSEGFREARLYAAEVNALFESGINPLAKIVATNGEQLLAGAWDQAEPAIVFPITDLVPTSAKMVALFDFIGSASLETEFKRLAAAEPPPTPSRACIAASSLLLSFLSCRTISVTFIG
jgi:hypothetical protein